MNAGKISHFSIVIPQNVFLLTKVEANYLFIVEVGNTARNYIKFNFENNGIDHNMVI